MRSGNVNGVLLYLAVMLRGGGVSPVELLQLKNHCIKKGITSGLSFSWLDLSSNYFLHTMVSKKCSNRTSSWHCTGRHVWAPCPGLKLYLKGG